MAEIAHDRRIGGGSTFGVALLLVAPSAVALFASWALAQRARFPASSLWLVYEISLYAGYVGVGVAALLAVLEAIRREISPVFRWLMAVLAVIGIFLLWYARHIYQNPWGSGA